MSGEEENIEGGTAEGKSSESKKVSEVKSLKDQEDTTIQLEENTDNSNKEISLSTFDEKKSEKPSTIKEPSKNSESVKHKVDGDNAHKLSEDKCHKLLSLDDDDDDDDDDKEKKLVPLLDQPLEVSGTRERKKVNRFNEEFNDSKEFSKLEIPEGSGTPLGEIPRIDASISRFKNEDLKVLHRLLYKCQGKTTKTKANIKKFSGFEFKKDSEEYKKKLISIQKFDLKQLKSICEMLDLEKKGTKDEVSERIINFLLEPQDIGKVPGGGRPRRSAAVKASNRGYSSHDSGSADETHLSRSKRGKGKRVNLKDESSSGSDEEFQPSDESEEVLRTEKAGRRSRGKRSSSEEVSDVSGLSSEESDADQKKRNKSKKIGNSSKKRAPLKRGRPANDKKKSTTTKRQTKEEDNESDAKNNDVSSSEDEPLIKKKTKSLQPPTDEEIKTCVKEILDGANLEEITMKTVCKQVYANYPNFDLSHKKDFIKSTVKSLIST